MAPTSSGARRDGRLRVVVGGFLGLFPAGGVTWDYVQYPLGFAALGHDVFYVEDTRLWPVYQDAAAGGVSCARNVEHLARVMAAFGMAERWAYRDEMTGLCHGLPAARVDELCRTADVFVNLSCSTPLREEHQAIPVRVLIDSDPMFTQIQHETEVGFTPGNGMRGLVAGHTHHFTFGENVAAPDCRMPGNGVSWRPTRQPICLDRWTAAPPVTAADASFTTVMNWSNGRALRFADESWGQKDVEFRRLLPAPARAGAPLAVAVGRAGADPFPVEEATRAGWRVLDAERVVPDWLGYRDFIRASRGELSVAKETYVKGRTGWFSCRSACYLASARPVVTQDTGWTRHLPSGRGLLGFTTLDEALAGVDAVLTDPAGHARAARAVAEEAFDARRVLGDLLAGAGLS